jgi:hypothetical protein
VFFFCSLYERHKYVALPGAEHATNIQMSLYRINTKDVVHSDIKIWSTVVQKYIEFLYSRLNMVIIVHYFNSWDFFSKWFRYVFGWQT